MQIIFATIFLSHLIDVTKHKKLDPIQWKPLKNLQKFPLSISTKKERKKRYSLVVHFPPLSRRFMTYLTWLISCHARAL